MSIVVQLLKNTQAWALALLLTFTATSKAALLFTSDGTAITITGSNPKATGVLIIPTRINNLPVTSIAYEAFAYCNGLTSVTIGTSVKSIGNSAFSFCSRLTSMTIPNSVTSIGYQSFRNCTGLTSFSVDIANSTFSSNDGVLFNKAQTSLLSFPNGKAGGYTIPNSVISIGGQAFSNCTGLTSVTIGTSVTSIGDGAFRECTELTTITIPSSVTSIGGSAFRECRLLSWVYFGGNLPTLGTYVFEGVSYATFYHLKTGAGWGPIFQGFPTALWAIPH